MTFIANIIIWLIRIYQIVISPILNSRCRFQITCSQYGINAIHNFGVLKGIWRTCIRILQCHPWVIKNNFFKNINIKDVFNMDSKRNFFIVAFLIISFILWQSWDTEYNNKSRSYYYSENYNKNLNTTNLTKPIDSSVNFKKNQWINNDNNIITVKTDVLLLKINTYGGDINEAYLIKYLDNLHSKKPFHLLRSDKEFTYQIQNKLIQEDLLKTHNQNTQLLYTNIHNKKEYVLSDHENEIKLSLMYQNHNLTYIKQYILSRNDYFIKINHIINNIGEYPLKIKLLGSLNQSINIRNTHDNNLDDNNFPLYSYRGAAYSTNKEKYQKYSFKDMKKTNLNIYSNGGWIAMLQKYFITAWLPINPKNCTFHSTYDQNNNNASINFESSDWILILPGEKTELNTILWIGPKIQEKMKLIDPNLNLVVDYGWLWFISQPLFKLLQFIHYYINNWGLSIILITLIIRFITYPLTKAQYTSMAKIRMLQPKLNSIQEIYKKDKYQYHQKIIELYKSEKVNPLGGCLPLFIQMPIFLALYYMLSGSIELRHAKFILWIHDLSSPDPYYILPIIMGITMFFIQKLSPTTISDPIQKKIMTIMLIIFTIFFIWFPAGLVLYYIASNIITIIQQQLIYHKISFKNDS